MLEILVHITTTVISGCIIAIFTHWLRNRNNKQATIATPKKSPHYGNSEGIGASMLVSLLTKL